MNQKIIECKIGERFEYDGVTLEVVEEKKTCKKCYFYNNKIFSDPCFSCLSRIDNWNEVIFKEVTK